MCEHEGKPCYKGCQCECMNCLVGEDTEEWELSIQYPSTPNGQKAAEMVEKMMGRSAESHGTWLASSPPQEDAQWELSNDEISKVKTWCQENNNKLRLLGLTWTMYALEDE